MDFDIKKRAKNLETLKKTPKKKFDYSGFSKSAYTDVEKEKMLIGYDKIPPEQWSQILPGTHIRYITKAGEFRRGGFVHNVKLKGKPMIFVESGRPGHEEHAKWPVAFEDIGELWKKRSAPIKEADRPTLGNWDEERIIQMEIQIENLSVELRKITQAVAKVYQVMKSRSPMVAQMSPMVLAQPRTYAK